LDATTIDLCLSMFPWAPFRSTKAAVKLHTLLDLRGAIPSFIHISDGKLHDVNVLDILLVEAGAFYVMDRGYLDFARLYALHRAGAFFVTRAKSNLDARRLYSAPTERSSGVIADQTIALNGFYSAARLSRASAPHPLQGPAIRQEARVPDQSGHAPRADHLRSLQESMVRRIVLSLDQAASSNQTLLRYFGKRGEIPNLDCRVRLCPRGHHQEAPQSRRFALYTSTDSFRHPFREDAHPASVSGRRLEHK
jgi:Transposase DDE domain